MKTYSPLGKSYVHIVEIPHNEISKIGIEQCAQPRETLSLFYNRQSVKPNVLMNAGLFGMNGGIPCFGLIIDGKVLANDGARIWGLGVVGNSDIAYGRIDGKRWNSWVSGYPVLIENGKKTTITDALELNYKTRRSIWGYSEKNVYLVTVDAPGMNFAEEQTLMSGLHCLFAINMDGGGSTRCMVNGKTITNGLENRAVDNVIAVYLKDGKNTIKTEGQEMGYTNSPLASVVLLSPNHSGLRNHKIDTITIHCVVGQLSAKGIGEVFQSTARQASSNYGIGYDGQIGLYVEEKNRSWCSSSASNDNRAITIEVASDTSEPYAVTDKAYAALLNLVTDICKRNGIKELKWKGDKSLIGQVDKQNMTVHRWFANKSCPGDYLYGKHPEIVAEVNKRLGVKANSSTSTANNSTTLKFKVGDIVQLTGNKTYKSSDGIQAYRCKPGKVKITQIANNKHPYHVVAIPDGGAIVEGWVDANVLKAITTSSKAYTARVTADVLNVRSGPGINYKIVTSVKHNEVYTIVEEKNGWGKLKSGAGWVSLNYMKKN